MGKVCILSLEGVGEGQDEFLSLYGMGGQAMLLRRAQEFCKRRNMTGRAEIRVWCFLSQYSESAWVHPVLLSSGHHTYTNDICLC